MISQRLKLGAWLRPASRFHTSVRWKKSLTYCVSSSWAYAHLSQLFVSLTADFQSQEWCTLIFFPKGRHSELSVFNVPLCRLLERKKTAVHRHFNLK